jgi:hypothetical protein
MKIKPEQLDRLATELIKRYEAKELMKATESAAAIKSKIVEIVSRNFAEEEAIEEFETPPSHARFH